MNKKKFLIVPLLLIILVIISFQVLTYNGNESNPNLENLDISKIQLEEKNNTKTILTEIINDDYLFRFWSTSEKIQNQSQQIQLSEAMFTKKPEFEKIYDELGVEKDKQKTVVIYPIFTSSAYSSPGFYDYYKKNCDESCLTTNIEVTFDYNASGVGIQILSLLGYEVINDIQVNNDPDILKKYDKVILLHNEYVTQTEFNAIINHPKVIYLYPNALYGEIAFDSEKNTITLIKGHGYPENKISNGFNWEFDNTPMEYDTECKEWKFYEIKNGVMLNCYPENIMFVDKELLKAIKEF